MILETLGMLCDAVACGDTSGYKGYCLDMASAVGDLGVIDVWLDLKTNVAADFATGDEYYQFGIVVGTGTDGTDINAGAITVIETPSIIGSDARLATAGAAILQCTLPYQANLRYLQLYYTQTGTSNAITIDFNISPTKPPSPYNRQVIESPVGVP